MKVTISTRGLKRLLAPVLPCAGKDYDLPILCTARLQVRGKYLTATATDRFRLGVCREPLSPDFEHSPDFHALVDARDLKRLLTIFKVDRWSGDTELTLEVLHDTHGDRLRVHSGGVLEGLSGTAVTVPLEAGEYPKVESLLAKSLSAPEPVAAVGSFNPDFLAAFKHAARDDEPLRVRVGKGGDPALVLCGDHFVGLLMPRRIHGDGATTEQLTATAGKEWMELLGQRAVTAS